MPAVRRESGYVGYGEAARRLIKDPIRKELFRHNERLIQAERSRICAGVGSAMGRAADLQLDMTAIKDVLETD